ncbi:MAG: nicotinate-nucleotide diphosphorylase (carboxylating), partial [Actinomycetota bacterium]|nr:nicotinate-nucleotide diphosphorylase (carboxylating) [Actinomycetota bacterium]
MLERQGLDAAEVHRVVRIALEEDLRYGPDVTTSATVGTAAVATGAVVPREPGVLAGGGVALAVLDAVLGPSGYQVLARSEDGDEVRPGVAVLTVTATAAGLLTAERTMLNLLCHLSGVATATAAWVRAVEGTHCR